MRFSLSRVLCYAAHPPLVALVLLGLALVGCRGQEPLRFTVLFDSAAGLEKGMPVVHRDLEVGEVVAVGLDQQGLVAATVELEDRYRGAVAHNSVIRSQSYGLRRRVRLSIEDGEGERIPVKDGDVLEGRARIIDDVASRLQEGARAAWQKTSEAASELQQRLAEAAEKGEEEVRRLQQESAPELRKQAEKVKQQLIDAGLEQEAEDFWRDFEGWLDGLADPESTEPPPRAPSPDQD